VSLAALIKAEQTGAENCKTCDMLARLTDQDRAEFVSFAAAGVAGAVLARAITARMVEMYPDESPRPSVGEASVRKHIDRGHGA
jgi:hypothetical protein